MERFSQFRDPGTGIAPFLKPVPAGNDRLSLVNAGLIKPLAVVFGALKVVLCLVLLAFYAALEVSYTAGVLPVSLFNLAASGLCRAILLALNVSAIKSTTLQKARKAASKDEQARVIVCNSSSYLDVLVLAMEYNPAFVQPVVGTQGKIEYVPVCLWKALRNTGNVPQVSDKGRPLETILLSTARPVALFPEVTTSNNRGLLKFGSIAAPKSPKKFKAQVVAVNYPIVATTKRPTATLPIPSRHSPFDHMLSLASSLSPYTIDVTKNGELEDAFPLDKLATSLALVSKKKKTGLDWTDKQKFLSVATKS